MKISVITISYNAATCIEDTIKSVISQQYDNFEYIIVDGNSNDGTLDIIKKYQNIIDKWISEPDSGIYNAMNKAIKMSSGDYCLFMNAGDFFIDKDVLHRADIFLDGKFDVLTGKEIHIQNNKVVDYIIPPIVLTMNRLYNSSICHQSSFIKRDLLLKFPYDEKLRLVSDWKFWIETVILNNAQYKAIDTDVACFNREGATYKQIELGKKERKQVLQELIPMKILNDYKGFNKRNLFHNFLFRTIRFLKRNYILYSNIFRIKKLLAKQKNF